MFQIVCNEPYDWSNKKDTVVPTRRVLCAYYYVFNNQPIKLRMQFTFQVELVKVKYLQVDFYHPPKLCEITL